MGWLGGSCTYGQRYSELSQGKGATAPVSAGDSEALPEVTPPRVVVEGSAHGLWHRFPEFSSSSRLEFAHVQLEGSPDSFDGVPYRSISGYDFFHA